MPSDQNTQGDELQIEVIPESEFDTGSQDTLSEGETEDTELNLELDESSQEDKLTPAQVNAKKQEDAWLNKVISGKSAVEDAPTWLQARLNQRLEATNNLPETEEVVRKVLEKEREAQEFKDLQAGIPKLTALQAKELQDKFAELKPLGKVKALKTAMDLMGLSSKMREAEMRGLAKGKMSLPRSGQPAVRKSEQAVGGVPLDVIYDERKWNDMIRKANQS